jgi:hypothetical protein
MVSSVTPNHSGISKEQVSLGQFNRYKAVALLVKERINLPFDVFECPFVMQGRISFCYFLVCECDNEYFK